MDKRTLLFVLSLSFTLFFVNLYFDHQRSEDRALRTQQMTARKEESIKKLEEDIAKRTAPASSLPLVALYADADATEKLAVAVESQQAVLAISWTENLPQKVYKKALDNGGKTVVLSLATLHPELGEPVVYRESDDAVLPVGVLPELGKYEVQLVIPSKDAAGKAYEIYLGDYVDGNLTIPAMKVQSLKHEIKADDKAVLPTIGEGFVMAKSGSKYIPVAIYNRSSRSMPFLRSLLWSRSPRKGKRSIREQDLPRNSMFWKRLTSNWCSHPMAARLQRSTCRLKATQTKKALSKRSSSTAIWSLNIHTMRAFRPTAITHLEQALAQPL
jgi:YidC/Oxa1 family membrane protein insertase